MIREVIWIGPCTYSVDESWSCHSSCHYLIHSRISVISSVVHTWSWSYEYACNRCTEKRDDGKVPQDVPGGVGARSGVGGPVRRNPRRRRNRGWALNLEPSSYGQGKPRSIISLLLSKQLIIYVICIVALSGRSWLEPLLHYIIPWPDIWIPESYVDRIDSMLSPA